MHGVVNFQCPQSLTSTWENNLSFADNECLDQPAHLRMRRLIWEFIVLLVYSTLPLNPSAQMAIGDPPRIHQSKRKLSQRGMFVLRLI